MPMRHIRPYEASLGGLIPWILYCCNATELIKRSLTNRLSHLSIQIVAVYGFGWLSRTF